MYVDDAVLHGDVDTISCFILNGVDKVKMCSYAYLSQEFLSKEMVAKIKSLPEWGEYTK